MKNEPFKLSVNGEYEFDVQPDTAKSLDVVPNGNQAFHLLQNSQAYQIELLESDYANRTYTLRIDGAKYTVKISDYYERLIQQLGLTTGGAHKINTVKAPMPGLVIHILAEPGMAVQKGDALVILEAMKMENVIKAAGDGVVKTVHTRKGKAVDKGQILLEFE